MEEQAAHLAELQAAVAKAEAAALHRQEESAEQRRAAADLGASVVILNAYERRLQRLASLLQHHEDEVQRWLAAVGAAAREGSSASLPDGWELVLQQTVQALDDAAHAAATAPGTEPTLVAERLLALKGRFAAAAAVLSAAGVHMLAGALVDSVQADLEAVSNWPAVQMLPAASAGPGADPVAAALGNLQLEQRHQWQAAVERQRRLDSLRAEVASARQALEGAGRGPACVAQKAARHAGLRVEVAFLDQARRKAEEAAAEAVSQAQQVREQRDALAAAEQHATALDATIQGMIVADSHIMRQWRLGEEPAREHVQARVLAQRQPLEQLSRQLPQAQREELAAFREARSKEGSCHDTSTRTGQPTLQPAAAAALKLDPLCALKTSDHAAATAALAAAELQQLLPCAERWAALAADSSTQQQELQQAAAALQQQVHALQQEEGSAAVADLRQAAAAMEEGMALAGRVRQALSDWWTLPAVAATPWLKRGGRTAEEWLRCLGEQQRAAQQRQTFTGRDESNSRLGLARS